MTPVCEHCGDALVEQIRHTLIETGYFHADDLDQLGVPPEHCNLKGSRSAWFRNKGFMESTGVYRKVAHPAANGRKAPTYRITEKGRAKLVGHRAEDRDQASNSLPGPVNATPSSVSGEEPTNGTINPEGQAANAAGNALDRPSGGSANQAASVHGAGDQPIAAEDEALGISTPLVPDASSELLELPIEEAPAKPSAYDPWSEAA